MKKRDYSVLLIYVKLIKQIKTIPHSVIASDSITKRVSNDKIRMSIEIQIIFSNGLPSVRGITFKVVAIFTDSHEIFGHNPVTTLHTPHEQDVSNPKNI